MKKVTTTTENNYKRRLLLLELAVEGLGDVVNVEAADGGAHEAVEAGREDGVEGRVVGGELVDALDLVEVEGVVSGLDLNKG